MEFNTKYKYFKGFPQRRREFHVKAQRFHAAEQRFHAKAQRKRTKEQRNRKNLRKLYLQLMTRNKCAASLLRCGRRVKQTLFVAFVFTLPLCVK
jgi:hypothetical protein